MASSSNSQALTSPSSSATHVKTQRHQLIRYIWNINELLDFAAGHTPTDHSEPPTGNAHPPTDLQSGVLHPQCAKHFMHVVDAAETANGTLMLTAAGRKVLEGGKILSKSGEMVDRDEEWLKWMLLELWVLLIKEYKVPEEEVKNALELYGAVWLEGWTAGHREMMQWRNSRLEQARAKLTEDQAAKGVEQGAE